MKILQVTGAVVGAILLFAATAQAAVVYDEGVSGDAAPAGSIAFSDPVAFVNLGLLGPGQNIVIGTVEGNGVDEYDLFAFTIAANWSFDVLAYSPGTDNLATGFALYNATASTLGDYFEAYQVSGPVNDRFSGTNGPGSYLIGMNEFGSTSPASYEFSITVASVPLPATAALMLAGLAALGSVAQARSAHRR